MKIKQATYLNPDLSLKGFKSYNQQVKENTGRKIADLRKEKGITLEELESISKVTRKQISAIEKGNLNYTIKTYNKLLYYLDGQKE